MAKKVVVAMSGGVDSSVSAALLKEQGYEVIGVFMHNGVNYDSNSIRTCCSLRDAQDAREVAFKLGIKFYSLDFSKEFSQLRDYFVNEYLNGRTPSPCIKCNSRLKFGVLLKYADFVQADFIATGHYTIVKFDGKQYVLLEGKDKEKDQSYFLFELTQEQLKRALFPVGQFTKGEVRKLAEKYSLKCAQKPESQDLCFIPHKNLPQFLENVLKERNGCEFNEQSFRGDFVDTSGVKLGEHRGYIYYTIGQRKGLGIAKGIPLYVTKILPQEKKVVLGTKEEVYSDFASVEKVNWVSIQPPQEGTEFEAEVKIRYKHPKAKAKVFVEKIDKVNIYFHQKQPAITPGQAACFYKDEVLLGGGWIV